MDIKCTICLKTFNTTNKKPLIYDCGHIVCLKCQYLQKKSNDLHCPMDKTPFDKEKKFDIYK